MTNLPASPPISADWQPGSIRRNPLPTLVTLWHWTVATGGPEKPLLSPDEWQRADTMGPGTRGKFIIHRSTLRRILAGCLDCDAAAIRFSYSRLGRPYLSDPNSDLDFNLSHSGDDAVLALSTLGAVGVDIERMRTLPDYLAIARRTWPSDWVARLAGIPLEHRQRSFFELWTRFEACQKAHGGGVFANVDCADRPALSFTLDSGCAGHLCLADSGNTLPKTSWLRLVDHD